MPIENTKVYLTLIIIILASLGVMFILSAVTIVRTQGQIDQNHTCFEENFLAHNKSFNRIVFTLHNLLSYDESGNPKETIIEEKVELCRSVVSNAKYIHELPDLNMEGLFEDDPLFLEERIKEQDSLFETILSELNRIFALIQDATTNEATLQRIAEFEDAGREMMRFLKSRNALMVQLDDYMFSHLQNDLEDVTAILRSFFLFHTVLTGILVFVSLLYYSFIRRTHRELVHSRNHLEEMVNLRTLDLSKKHDELQSALEEKEYLLKEVHHRVKNNLALISSMVNLQMANAEDEKLKETLTDVSNRIHSIALVHQKIYQSRTLAKIDFQEYVTDLSESIVDSLSTQDINLEISIAQVQLSPEVAIPLGIILSELITNALKYGFKDKSEGKILLNLTSNDGMMELKIHNDGHPFPDDVDFRDSPSLGLTLVCALVEQIEGTIDLERQNGTFFTIRFSAHE